jgi:hypothetical protein
MDIGNLIRLQVGLHPRLLKHLKVVLCSCVYPRSRRQSEQILRFSPRSWVFHCRVAIDYGYRELRLFYRWQQPKVSSQTNVRCGIQHDPVILV